MSAIVTTDVALAAGILRQGGLVAFATETVYGLGADATNAQAVARIFEAKNRPLFDPLIVHIATAADIDEVCTHVPPRAQRLIDRFWPGPLTLVLPKQDRIPPLVTSGLPNVGVRLPAHPLARELIKQAGVPVAAPSANLFGRISPTSVEHVREQLGERIDCILDGGACAVGIESTVLSLVDQEHPLLLRPGGVPVEAIESVIGPVTRQTSPGILTAETAPQAAPGMLEQHYAPSKPLELVTHLGDLLPAGNIGVLTFRGFHGMDRFRMVEILSEQGSLTEAAAQLFAALHRLDRADIQRIVAERCPDDGLGRAINDRLYRASVKHR